MAGRKKKKKLIMPDKAPTPESSPMTENHCSYERFSFSGVHYLISNLFTFHSVGLLQGIGMLLCHKI